MDILLAGEDQSQADQPNSLAEGPPVSPQSVCGMHRPGGLRLESYIGLGLTLDPFGGSQWEALSLKRAA
eukprot:1143338-Pelagomonas_calceolata.AAC.1